MRSEIRRAAKALVATRVETFEVTGPVEAARARVEHALAELGTSRALRYSGAWNTVDGRTSYVATFDPSPRTPRLLNIASFSIVLLIAASAWALFAGSDQGPARFLLPMITVLVILGLPFVFAGFAAAREAEEARILRALRAALADGR